MKKTLTVLFFLFSFTVFSQKHSNSVSPIHTAATSNKNISYVVGKIFVISKLPELENKTENIELNEINIYPNPVSNFLYIRTTDNSNIKKITIFDFVGRMVFSKNLENNCVDLSFLENGTYMVLLDNKVFKIIKTN